MASVYPTAIDDFVTNRTGSDSKTGHAAVHNDLADAIEKIEGELGINPSGTQATVRARLDQLQPAAPLVYTVANYVTDRSYDANSYTMDELADVLGTLISDLQTRGVIG